MVHSLDFILTPKMGVFGHNDSMEICFLNTSVLRETEFPIASSKRVL